MRILVNGKEQMIVPQIPTPRELRIRVRGSAITFNTERPTQGIALVLKTAEVAFGRNFYYRAAQLWGRARQPERIADVQKLWATFHGVARCLLAEWPKRPPPKPLTPPRFRSDADREIWALKVREHERTLREIAEDLWSLTSRAKWPELGTPPKPPPVEFNVRVIGGGGDFDLRAAKSDHERDLYRFSRRCAISRDRLSRNLFGGLIGSYKRPHPVGLAELHYLIRGKRLTKKAMRSPR